MQFGKRLLLLPLAGWLLSCSQNNPKAEANIKLNEPSKLVVGNPYQQVDQSPMDMIYYPINYPISLLEHPEMAAKQPVARVIFSRPHKKERTVFGSDSNVVVRYGRNWRLGANEATEIEFMRPVMINKKNINQGRYTLYAIPHPDRWEIAVNKNSYNWGLKMDSTKDITRITVPVEVQDPPLEYFTMKFMEAPDGAGLLMGWDNVKVVMPVQFSK